MLSDYCSGFMILNFDALNYYQKELFLGFNESDIDMYTTINRYLYNVLFLRGSLFILVTMSLVVRMKWYDGYTIVIQHRIMLIIYSND